MNLQDEPGTPYMSRNEEQLKTYTHAVLGPNGYQKQLKELPLAKAGAIKVHFLRSSILL